jgi:CubicO group peptidase (beta-lactamase class C family)
MDPLAVGITRTGAFLPRAVIYATFWLVCAFPFLCVARDNPRNLPQDSTDAYNLRPLVNVKTWGDGGAISRFVYLHSSEVFPAAIIKRSGSVSAMTVKLRPEIGDFVVDKQAGADVTLRQVLQDIPLDGFLILHKGQVVYEQYPRMKPDDRHLAFSVSKAFTGTLIGILEDRKLIDLDRHVDYYLPELAGTSWSGSPVRDVADMASGVEGVEDSADAYTNPSNKHFLLEACLGWQPKSADMPDAVRESDPYKYLASFKRVHATGQSQEYASVNTFVLAEIIEKVTGKRLAEVISSEIWSKMGAEADGLMLVNERGVAIAHAGMVMTLRDLARFGLLYAEASHQTPENRVIPEQFLKRLFQDGRPELLGPKPPAWLHHASYQWDAVGKNGELIKGGFANQLLYIDCKKDVVIAYFGTNTAVDTLPTLLPLRRLVEQYF